MNDPCLPEGKDFAELRERLIAARTRLDAEKRLDDVFYVCPQEYIKILKYATPEVMHWLDVGVMGMQIKPHPRLRGVDYQASTFTLDVGTFPVHLPLSSDPNGFGPIEVTL